MPSTMQLFFHVLFKATFRDDPTKPANKKNYNPSKISKICLTELQTTVKNLARSELFQMIITFLWDVKQKSHLNIKQQVCWAVEMKSDAGHKDKICAGAYGGNAIQRPQALGMALALAAVTTETNTA